MHRQTIWRRKLCRIRSCHPRQHTEVCVGSVQACGPQGAAGYGLTSDNYPRHGRFGVLAPHSCGEPILTFITQVGSGGIIVH